MKTEEDEAFEAIARRQGGFQAKRQMAMDKLQEPICDKDPHGCWNVRCQLGKQCKNLAQPAQESQDIASLVEGMEVSIDVSTGEHDSGNRLFGTVTLAQENQSSKHGLILLVQEPEPNFNPAPLPAQEPVAWTLLLTGEHHGIIGKAGDQFLGHPKHYERVDVYTTPPQRPWVGLTDDEVNNFAAGCHLGKSVQGAIYEAEAKLKEKNNET